MIKELKKPSKIPKEVKIPLPRENEIIERSISFYTQDKRKFKVVSSEVRRRLREVRVEDILYRYLPGSIRPITKVFLIQDINLRSREVSIAEANEQTLTNIWGNDVTDIDYCLNLSLIKKGRIFTTSDVELRFKIYSQPGDPQDWIVIYKYPQGVKIIRKDYEDVTIKLPDGKETTIKIPRFKLCGYKVLSSDVAQQLTTKTVTRGVYISMKTCDVIGFLEAITSKLQNYIKSFTNTVRKDKEENARELESVKTFSILVINDYIHYATHLILNIASELSGIRIDDLEHYIAVQSEDDKLQRFLMEFILNKDYKSVDPFKIEIVIANEIDLIEKIKWHEVCNKVLSLRNSLRDLKPDTSIDVIINELISRLYMPRCFYEPLMLEDIISQGLSGENLQVILNDLTVILELSKYVVNKVVQRIGKFNY